jgi:hypothetical protein
MSDLFKRTGAEDFSKFLKVMISGPPKSGKTTLLGTVPNILVLDTEPHANNLESIAHLDIPYATITNSEDLRFIAATLSNETLRKQLAREKYGMDDIGAVAIDTMDTLQKLLKVERMKEQKSTQFLRDDWGWLKTEMEEIVQLFTSLPMHVFFVVHTKTKEMGKGDDSYSIVLPGLEGAISESIAGMVGYSLLSFRKEEVAPDGTAITKYWLRTEGDSAHDFLGTRTAGRLPTIIEPNMKTIYDTVMANRPKKKAAPAPAAPAPAAPPAEEAAQNPGQAEAVQTPVQTPEPTPPAAEAPAETPPAEKPADDQPITPAAAGHVKKVYDALEIAYPEDVVMGKTIGEARELVKFWRAVQQDHNEGKGMPGVSPQGEMLELMSAQGWLPEDGPGEKEPEKAVEPKVDGTIEEVKAYVGDDLARANEAFEVERSGRNRKTLMDWLESKGASHGGHGRIQTEAEPAVQTPVENPAPAAEEAVTPEPAPADTPPTEDEAVKALEDGLGATTIEEGINPAAPCQVCGGKLDDLDLAELGKKRFDKLLCVNDYLAELKK